jgi:hypothetical protein
VGGILKMKVPWQSVTTRFHLEMCKNHDMKLFPLPSKSFTHFKNAKMNEKENSP